MIKGKNSICYTDKGDFMKFKGVGNDAMFRRYDSVWSVLQKHVPAEYQSFLAEPKYDDATGQITWYTDAEGPGVMAVPYDKLTDAERAKADSLFAENISRYQEAAKKLSPDERRILNDAIAQVRPDHTYLVGNRLVAVAWGMEPDNNAYVEKGCLIHDLGPKRWMVTFAGGDNGNIPGINQMHIIDGEMVPEALCPDVNPDEGFAFDCWRPNPAETPILCDTTFTAFYKPAPGAPVPPPVDEELPEEPNDDVNVTFDAGGDGTVEGESTLVVPRGTMLTAANIPAVRPNPGRKFVGWNIDPAAAAIDNDVVFTACYASDKKPWWKRWWRWLLWLLLLLLIILLLIWLLRKCERDKKVVDPVVVEDALHDDTVTPLETIKNPDGTIRDDNGYYQPITDDKGEMIIDGDEWHVAPPLYDEHGERVPIIDLDDGRRIINNRLILFIDDDNAKVEDLLKRFKELYPDGTYQVIGYDSEVKSAVIQVPPGERDRLREELPERISSPRIFVLDEEIMELTSPFRWGERQPSAANKGWHIPAMHIKEAWKITRGDPNVIVAVVDDGFDTSHPMLDNSRMVKPYNVFTRNNKLSKGCGHGTHTVALAAGSDKFVDSQKATGVAPGCKFMPIQVFDGNMCPLSAWVSGVMYAINNGAQVVNMSIAPCFTGFDHMSPDQQMRVSETQFKNVERLWTRVCQAAARRNVILVFAAGNNNIISVVCPENRHDGSLSVGAVDKDLCATDFTNYAAGTDISAPGRDINSAWLSNGYRMEEGTSMAAPLVAGTVALMKSLKRDLTVEQAFNVLYATGADVYCNIPPSVLVDEALKAVKAGKFDKPAKRPGKRLPDAWRDRVPRCLDDFSQSPLILDYDNRHFSGDAPYYAPGPGVPDGDVIGNLTPDDLDSYSKEDLRRLLELIKKFDSRDKGAKNTLIREIEERLNK